MKRVIFILVFVLFAATASAQVAVDAAFAVAAGTGTLTWTHTPVGTPRAITVQIACLGTSDCIDAVDIGGTPIPEVSCSPLLGVAGPGSAYMFFLGSGIPSGAQTMTITKLTADIARAVSVTLTATGDTEVIDCDATVNSAAVVNPSVTLSVAGRTSWAGLSGVTTHLGVADVTPFTNWTSSEVDNGNVHVYYRYNTIDTADVAAGWTQASAGATMVAVAVAQVVAGTAGRGILLGIGP